MNTPWIEKDDLNWRLALLILLLIAFLGPWAFEQINVPSEYPCSAPFIRLKGDFCGEPIPGILIYRWFIDSFIYTSTGLLTGELDFSVWISEIFLYLFVFLSLLPIFSTLLLILCGNHQCRQVFTIIAWLLAIGAGLFWGLVNYSTISWRVWGIWLYIGIAISALILEILALVKGRKLNQKPVPAPHS